MEFFNHKFNYLLIFLYMFEKNIQIIVKKDDLPSIYNYVNLCYNIVRYRVLYISFGGSNKIQLLQQFEEEMLCQRRRYTRLRWSLGKWRIGGPLFCLLRRNTGTLDPFATPPTISFPVRSAQKRRYMLSERNLHVVSSKNTTPCVLRDRTSSVWRPTTIRIESCANACRRLVTMTLVLITSLQRR